MDKKEYIERGVLIEMLDSDGVIDGFTYSDGETLLQKINKVPTDDVVKVVRCKNCLYSHEDPNGFLGYVCEKPLWLPVIGERPHRKPVQDCDFCSYGVLRSRES